MVAMIRRILGQDLTWTLLVIPIGLLSINIFTLTADKDAVIRRYEEKKIEQERRISVAQENKKLDIERAKIYAAEAEKRRAYIYKCAKSWVKDEEDCAKQYDRIMR